MWKEKCFKKDCPFLHPKLRQHTPTPGKGGMPGHGGMYLDPRWVGVPGHGGAALACLTNQQKSSALARRKYASHMGEGAVHVQKTVKTIVVGGGPAAKVPPKPLCGMFSFVLDDSGSMAGSRKREMMDGFDHATDIIQNRKAKDLISTYAFGDRVKVVMGFTPAKMVKPRIVRDKLDKADTGARTALLDGIAMALDSIDRKNQKDFCELMVITDGEENCSEISEHALIQKIRSPGIKNFHMTLIYVGDSDAGVAKLHTLASGIKHVYVLSLNQAKGCFKKAFEKYMQQAQKRIQTWTVTETKVTYRKRA
jgi:uncharacterized protein YegL